jgi:DNA-binding MltR family transcriptional regulator
MAKHEPFTPKVWDSMAQPFEHESDRGAVLLFAAILDNQLGHFLRQQMVDHEVSDKLVFNDMAPLGGFGPRINLGFALGLISIEDYRTLDSVRRIRNRFAHDPEIITFADDQVVTLCGKLTARAAVLAAKGPATLKARHTFLLACSLVSGSIHRAEEEFAKRRAAGTGLPFNPREGRDDPV